MIFSGNFALTDKNAIEILNARSFDVRSMKKFIQFNWNRTQINGKKSEKI